MNVRGHILQLACGFYSYKVSLIPGKIYTIIPDTNNYHIIKGSIISIHNDIVNWIKANKQEEVNYDPENYYYVCPKCGQADTLKMQENYGPAHNYTICLCNWKGFEIDCVKIYRRLK